VDTTKTSLKYADQSGAIRITTRHSSGQIVVPQDVAVEEIEGEMWIKYRFPVSGAARGTKGALAAFITFADEPVTEEKILAFVQKWGVLCFCGCDRIASHNTKCIPICDEPLYSELITYLGEQAKDDIEAIEAKMFSATQDVWFREPIRLWCRYAREIAALLRIAFRLRGDWHGSDDALPDWSILRGIGASDDLGRMIAPIPYYESQIHTPIHNASLTQKCHVIGNIISLWMGDGYFVPHIEWIHQSSSKISGPIAQIVLNATYEDACLFNSEYLTLYSVLIAQCITALSSTDFIKQCNCPGCENHVGSCQHLLEVKFTPGRPSSYCEICRLNIHRRQKSASRRRRSATD
jgi:hypothetical protein